MGGGGSSAGTFLAEFLMKYPEVLRDVPRGKIGKMEKYGEMGGGDVEGKGGKRGTLQ